MGEITFTIPNIEPTTAVSNPQSRYTDYAQACWDELNKKGH